MIQDIAKHVDVVCGNVINLNEIIEAIKKYNVTKIIHLAFLLGQESDANPLKATYINVIGTLNIFEAAKLMNCERVCTASSISIYGFDNAYDPSELPVSEDAPIRYRVNRTYAAGKVYMEEMAQLYREEHGTLVCGLRPSFVYGLGRKIGRWSIASEMIEKAVMGEPVCTTGGNVQISMVYVDDVADAWIALLEADKKRFKHYFYNTGGDATTLGQIGKTIKQYIPGAKIEITPGSEIHGPSGAASVSSKVIAEELGFRRKYTPLEVGIQAMISDVKKRLPHRSKR